MTQKTQITAETKTRKKHRNAKLAAALKTNLARRKAAKNHGIAMQNAASAQKFEAEAAAIVTGKKEG